MRPGWASDSLPVRAVYGMCFELAHGSSCTDVTPGKNISAIAMLRPHYASQCIKLSLPITKECVCVSSGETETETERGWQRAGSLTGLI